MITAIVGLSLLGFRYLPAWSVPAIAFAIDIYLVFSGKESFP
jgi:hypothetical protein